MQFNCPDRNANATACGAAFTTLREKLAREVSGSAMLSVLLEKLNGMQEACARPADFKLRFDEFIARAAEHLDIVRPFVPQLVRFLPAYAEPRAFEPQPIAVRAGSDFTWERGVDFRSTIHSTK
jgi:hypothetical protein